MTSGAEKKQLKIRTLAYQDKQDMGTAGEVGMNSNSMFSYGLQHMDTLVLADQQKLIYISSVWTLDTAYTTFLD